ncbi:acyl transferase/acyl hydrolase/lysophospholipase [Parachaetomium inaequale]|uniref:Acyl transferase/acyl hydrolase/lysophospholipase n=1 Tax=Parachaetomium inaequale TaxID=2588326 RepID=A0AAN6P550_9PEZI|nr:acyl transferase/acyl hydrolase/lysophospholipase [Parachaetomium inaequale]
MPATDLRLLALDGGGVRGLSSLMILRRLMATVNPDAPPKPCDYFDMIGGTSTSGLIAVMLGRLRITVDECIDAYTMLSDRVFEKKSYRVTLERVVKTIVVNCSLDIDILLEDPNSPCKVFVYATSKETSDINLPSQLLLLFVDRALGTNNPGSLKCLISISIGLPALQPIRDNVLGIWAALKDLFNIDYRLEEIRLKESKQKTEITATTRCYVES